MNLRRSLFAALAVTCGASGLRAAPLDQPACAALDKERGDLIASGLKTDMEKGPAWAKANLAAERLDKIQRLIAIEEQLSFRCDKLVTAPPQIKEPPKPEPAKADASASKQGGDIFEGLNFGNLPPPKRKTKPK